MINSTRSRDTLDAATILRRPRAPAGAGSHPLLLPRSPGIIIPCLFFLLLVACGRNEDSENAASRLIDTPQRYLPGPHDCPENWTFISQSLQANTVFIANYKRTIEAEAPDYLTIRVELGTDIPAAVANYRLLRTRLQQQGDTFVKTTGGLGERSTILTVLPRHILFQRANAVMEVKAERQAESALIFARLIDQRLETWLSEGPAETHAQPADTRGQASPP